ncbi:MAG: ATP-binding cassette domain-containing protein, partial [Propionibacteriaceae bacterium]|nr:ATP-binding cassette domain-containing protein [Propionibacteriaceae bacterium]
GSGKTTLLDLLAHLQFPQSGTVKQGKTLHLGYLSQSVTEMDGSDQVLQSVERIKRSTLLAKGEASTSSLLEGFGFTGQKLVTRIGDLSGGERRRLQFLRLLLTEPNVLLLDEPTNDLDIDTLQVIEDYLDSWPGTLIAVSHDRYFLERVTDQQYALIDGRLRHLPGGVDEYLRLRQTPPPAPNSSTATANKTGPSPASPASSSAAERAVRKELAATERKLERLSTRIAALHDQMAAHDQSDYTAVNRLWDDLRQAESETTALEERWLELSELADQ